MPSSAKPACWTSTRPWVTTRSSVMPRRCRRGQRVPDGKHYHGSPAVETTSDYCPIENVTLLRAPAWTVSRRSGSWLCSRSRFRSPHPAAGPLGALLRRVRGAAPPPAPMRLTSAIAAALGRLLSRLSGGGVAGRLCRSALLPSLPRDRQDLVLYGFHYSAANHRRALSNSRFFNLLFGDSSAIVHYMRFVGWNLNKVEQTGSNFGTNQQHDNPFLCDIGSGTMVSDGLSMINMRHVEPRRSGWSRPGSATTTISATTSTIRRMAAPVRTVSSAPR